MIALLSDPALRTVAVGTAAIGGLAGFIGTFAVVRRQSLQGDAISHAALPGLALAFLIGARAPVLLIVAAGISGWMAMALVGGLANRKHVTFDTALGGSLAVFFGIGLALLTYVKKNVRGAAEHGLERYLFGQAATMRESDLLAVAAVGTLTVGLVIAFWKPIQLLCFDPDYAVAQGWPIRRIQGLLTGLIVLAVVVGLQAVGVVLMSALLVAPAVAAKLWLNRLGAVTVLAAIFGALAGLAGTLLSHGLSADNRTVPTGPMIVLSATVIVAGSLLKVFIRARWRPPGVGR